MSWTNPSTWVALATVTAAQLNEQIRDNLTWLKAAMTTSGISSDSALSKIKSAKCGASVSASGDTTATDTTDKTLLWDTEAWDTDGFHSTSSNTHRITIPSGLDGTYLFTANVAFEANATGDRAVWIEDSGGTVRAKVDVDSPSASERCEVQCVLVYEAAAGDWFAVHVQQNSGGTRTVYQSLSRYNFKAVRLFAA